MNRQTIERRIASAILRADLDRERERRLQSMRERRALAALSRPQAAAQEGQQRAADAA